MTDAQDAFARAYAGGPERHRTKAAEQGKLPVRERVAQLLDAGSFSEDALLANWEAEGLGADGVVTGMGTIGGRTVALMANDPTVKAGSWGPKTVEKILRIQEAALAHRVPMVYLVDSAGARITEQVQMFPGRRHAGRIFFNEVQLSGTVPQVCVLFGPSAAGGAYIPAFCDVVIMRDGNASMYLGSPRMAEMVIGEHVSLEEMGGAKMHTGVSGCGHFLVKTDEEGIELAKRYLGYFPSHWEEAPPPAPPAPPAADARPIRELIPADENKPWDMRELLDALVDDGSFLEVHKRWAKEVIVGYARLDGRVVGIVANQPKFKGGVLFVDSADKAARFIWTCNAFGIPLLFLADVPGLHDRHRGRAPGHHPPRREDDLGGVGGDRAEAVRDRAQGVRRRALRDGGAGVRARRLHRAPDRQDRRDGAERCGQCGVLQPARGDRGRGRARREARRADGGVRRGRRPPAPRVRARDRRGRAARGPARRSRAALRALRGPAPAAAGKRNAIPPA